MRNKSKLIGGVTLALFVVGAILMPAPSVGERELSSIFVKQQNFIFNFHFIDDNNNFIKGWGKLEQGDKLYTVTVPDDADVMEGYFERWHSITGKSYGVSYHISHMKKGYGVGIWHKVIPCNDLNDVYPFSIDVSEYRGTKMSIGVGFNRDDVCPTDTKQLAFDLIDATESRISELKREGVETAEIEELVKSAKEKYEAGDHVEAAKIATDAKSRADLAYHNKKTFIVDFGLFPPVLPTTTTPTPLPSPTPAPTPTSSVTLTPSPTPTHLPPIPPNDGGKGIGKLVLQLLLFFGATALVIVLIKPMMLKYYRWKMRKWEKEGYDVSKLKEVLGDEK